jgi:hypothetical protein
VQQNGAISVLGIMFVLDLSIQFLKYLTILRCTDVTFCDFKSTSTVASVFVCSCLDGFIWYTVFNHAVTSSVLLAYPVDHTLYTSLLS